MIKSLKDLLKAPKMLFSQFFAGLRSLTIGKGYSTKESASAARDFQKTSFLKENDNLDSKNKLNQALKEIDKSIQREGASNQINLRKADILLRKGRFHQARQLLNKLSDNRKAPETSIKARELLALSQKLEQEHLLQRNQDIVSGLHLIAKNFSTKLSHLPEANNFSPDHNLEQIIYKESLQAQANELPKLSIELIDQITQTKHQSPRLLANKALSLSMMGQKKKAVSLLTQLKKTNKDWKLAFSINKTLYEIQKTGKLDPLRRRDYFIKQSTAIANGHSLEAKFIREAMNTNKSANIKPLIFKEARAALNNNPKASLGLANTILDYFPNYPAALQLKGEALSAVDLDEEAIQTWKGLTRSQNENIAEKAHESIADLFSKKAKKISNRRSPKAAILFFIEQLLDHGFSPRMNDGVSQILKDIEPKNQDFPYPELQNHQLQLLFNSLVIECLEARLRKQGHLDAAAAAQKPGAIRKTAQKAG